MQLSSHQLTWQRAGESNDKLHSFFMPALAELGASVIVQNLAGDYLFVTHLPAPWKVSDNAAPTDRGLFGEDIGGKLQQLKSAIRKPGDKSHVEFAVGSENVYEFHIQAVGAELSDVHVVTTILDRSEERHRERLLRALLREVSHRSKNLLAIIQSIALQTARYSGTLDMFLHKFRGRLYSLSQSQDLITDSSWRGAYFRELVQQQTEKYLPENADRVVVRGDDVLLTPNASLHIGLALHELIVNAVSHGSLLTSGQAIVVTCNRVLVEGHASLEVLWQETLSSGPAGTPLSEEGLKGHFGSTVLERVVPASVNGKARYTIADGEIFYGLTFPLEFPE